MRSPSLLALLAVLLAGPAARAFVPPKHSPASVRADMVLVPGATYKYGAEAHWQGPTPGQLPAIGIGTAGVDVSVPSFFMDRTEVTAGAYATCVAAGACPALTQGDTSDSSLSPACTFGKPGLENHPVNCVAHAEAAAYCAFAGKRLPTDVEWELAARGKDGRPFPWGDAYPTAKHLNACDASLQRDNAKYGKSYVSMWGDTGDDGWSFTAPAGTYPDGASPYGVLDLSGNVEEWLGDPWWDITPSGPPTAATPNTGAGSDFIVRGGAFDLNSADSFAVTRRLRTEANTRAAWLGFRCASDA